MEEILHQLIGSYSQGFIHLRWLARFLPSTLSCEVLEGKFGDAMSYKSLGHFAPVPWQSLVIPSGWTYGNTTCQSTELQDMWRGANFSDAFEGPVDVANRVAELLMLRQGVAVAAKMP